MWEYEFKMYLLACEMGMTPFHHQELSRIVMEAEEIRQYILKNFDAWNAQQPINRLTEVAVSMQHCDNIGPEYYATRVFWAQDRKIETNFMLGYQPQEGEVMQQHIVFHKGLSLDVSICRLIWTNK